MVTKSIRCRLDCATWCEYFKSGECTSPVKCKYQTEHMSVEFLEAIFFPTEEAWQKLQAENSRLTAENAELRARLECSIEFPCKVGDTIYYINPYKEQPKIDEFKVTSLCKDKFQGRMIYVDNGEFFFAKTDGLFFTRAEAEARLKELKGDKQ